MTNSQTQHKEKEFYILTINSLNSKMRQHTRETVQGWIDDLENKVVQHYKIEYAIDVLESQIKHKFINDSLYCGIVTKLELRGDDLYAIAKFKQKTVPNPEMLTNPNFYDHLELTPKGEGNVKNNIIYNYKLIGFNLVEKSCFRKPIPQNEKVKTEEEE